MEILSNLRFGIPYIFFILTLFCLYHGPWYLYLHFIFVTHWLAWCFHFILFFLWKKIIFNVFCELISTRMFILWATSEFDFAACLFNKSFVGQGVSFIFPFSRIYTWAYDASLGDSLACKWIMKKRDHIAIVDDSYTCFFCPVRDGMFLSFSDFQVFSF